MQVSLYCRSLKCPHLSRGSVPEPGVSKWREEVLLECPATEAFSLVWDINRRHEWMQLTVSTKVLEKTSERSEIVYLIGSFLGKETDYCFLQTRKILSNGDVAIIGCDVNHKDVPITTVSSFNLNH